MKRLGKIRSAWLAALIDGEGTVMYVRHRRGKAAETKCPWLVRSITYRPRVGVYNTDRRLMDAIVGYTGIDRVYQHKMPVHKQHAKIAYEWRLIASECRAVLSQVMPYLVLKKEQAQLLVTALAIHDKLRSVKGEKWLYADKKLRDATRGQLHLIAERMNKLNRKNRRGDVGGA